MRSAGSKYEILIFIFEEGAARRKTFFSKISSSLHRVIFANNTKRYPPMLLLSGKRGRRRWKKGKGNRLKMRLSNSRES